MLVRDDFPLYLAYRIYRTMGLSQLFVVNQYNELRGVITRNDLLLHEAAHAKGKHAEEAVHEAHPSASKPLCHWYVLI